LLTDCPSGGCGDRFVESVVALHFDCFVEHRIVEEGAGGDDVSGLVGDDRYAYLFQRVYEG
jgi:hypothetical protein